MEQELFDIFSDCVNKSNENKFFKINIEQVIRTIYNYKKNKSLKKFIIVKNKLQDSNRLAMYSPIEKRILIYGENLAESGVENSVGICNNVTMILYEFIQVLIHEIEHSRQYTLTKNKRDDSLERKLLLLTCLFDDKMIDVILKRNLKYNKEKVNRTEWKERHHIMYKIWNDAYQKKFYDTILLERLAEYTSYSTLARVFFDKSGYEFFYLLSLAYLKNIMIRGYKLEDGIVTSPTITTIEYLKEKKFYYDVDLDWYTTDKKECLDNLINLYDFNTRYQYGLPISADEYKQQAEDVKKINKKLKKKYKVAIKTTK